MSRGGRPLRFLALALGGWTAARVFVLWPATLASGEAGLVPPALASDAPVAPMRQLAPLDRPPIAAWTQPSPGISPTSRRVAYAGSVRDRTATPRAFTFAALVRHSEAAAAYPVEPPRPTIPPPLAPAPFATAPGRLAGSAWLIARGGADGTLLGGQLGASQAGARLTYALGEARRVALSARIASPLRGRGREAAFGLDWQPTRMPLHLLAEQRVSLDGGGGGPTLLVIGGINPTPIAAGFRIEGYGEAGAIKRTKNEGGVEAFGDGAARLTHAAARLGPVRLDLGAGLWGAGQRGARRLDIGPTAGAVIPVAARSLRMTLDWRERIAGNAAPGSGPALSLGTDF